jgi:biotin carboxyl carrier protein
MKYNLFAIFLLVFASCVHQRSDDEGEKIVKAVTPVQVTSPKIGAMSDYIELNATTSFLRKETIKSTANGYIVDINITIGEKVRKGDTLFMLKTKEARAIDNLGNTQNNKLGFSGRIPVLSTKDGVVSAILHQKGDYVQDADQLATVAEQSSLVFLIDAPFEYHKYMNLNKSCKIILPDGEQLAGIIQSGLPIMDVNNQTQNFVIKASGSEKLPEGLIARVKIETEKKADAVILPKSAVLADEKEESFWVMKLLNDSTAVKIPVILGLQNDEEKEIIAPVFSGSDRVISSGNYGLPDTAKIKIEK